MALSPRRLFVVILWCGLLILPVHEVVDPDYWWHLRTGQQILQQRSLPHNDIYSFTSIGKTWITHEWLSEVVMYSVYQMAGHAGVLLMFALVVAAAFGIAYRRCPGKPFVAGFAVLLGALAGMPTLGARPQMFTVLFASIFLAVLGNYLHGGAAGKLWWLVPAMLLWANLHGGFVVGLGLIVLTCVGLVLDECSREVDAGSIQRRLRPLLYLLLACTAVVAINPNGLRLYGYPLATIRSSASNLYITEWASPDFHKLASQALAVLMLCTFGVLALSPKRARTSDLLLLLVTCYAALRSGRHVPLFALVAIPLLSEHVLEWLLSHRKSAWVDEAELPIPTAKAVLNAALLLLLVVGFAFRIEKALKDQQAHEAERWPLAAVQFMQAHALPPELYNSYDWGGYLIWKLYPQYRVSIDGRADVHGDALVAESIETYKGTGNWEDVLSRRKIRTVIVGPNAPLSNLLQESCHWEKVYTDAQAEIFVGRESVSVVSACVGRVP
jgi:hypothetical protein